MTHDEAIANGIAAVSGGAELAAQSDTVEASALPAAAHKLRSGDAGIAGLVSTLVFFVALDLLLLVANRRNDWPSWELIFGIAWMVSQILQVP